MDLISVIIPVYNRESMIEECLTSVLTSTYRNLEVIVIDDGSTDGTLALCRKMQASDPRIKVLQGEHAGVSKARNMGLDAATGAYVFFIDSDDVIHQNLLEILHKSLKDSDARIAATGVVNVHESRWHLLPEHIQKLRDLAEVEYHSNAEAIHQMFRWTTPINLIGGVMMCRQLIGNTRFSEELFIGEDFYFVYQNVIKGCPVVFTKAKLYYCRLHHNSSCNYSFEGFLTRFNRRVMVWKNEEALGRYDNAALQKKDAWSCYTRCLFQNKPHSADVKKMRQHMRQYKKELVSPLSLKLRLMVYFSLYAPMLYCTYKKILRRLHAIKSKK